MIFHPQAEYEERLLFLCSSGTGDISEFQYLLSQPGLDTNIYNKVRCIVVITLEPYTLIGSLHPQNGRTPLYWLSAYSRTELVQLLLEHGAEVDLPNDVSIFNN